MNKLAESLRDRMEMEKLSTRDVASKTKVSHSTIARALKGETVEVDTLISLSKWLGVPVNSMLDVKDDPDEVLQQIVRVASMEPELMKIFGEIADGVLNGTLDKSVLAEVAAFASYRLQLHKHDNEEANIESKVEA